VADPTLTLELCAPEKPPTKLEVAEVLIPGTAGVFTVHPGHTPILSTLIPGVLVATDAAGKEHHFAIHGGFAEVKQDEIVILSNFYEPGDDIETERAAEAEARAQARLQKPPEGMDWDRAELALARSLARQSASRKQGYN
jgi:F-type H+-transporting ATPase subunit epsilon